MLTVAAQQPDGKVENILTSHALLIQGIADLLGHVITIGWDACGNSISGTSYWRISTDPIRGYDRSEAILKTLYEPLISCWHSQKGFMIHK